MIVAGMATMWDRRRNLHAVVESLIDQVDALGIYLNGYEEIPRWMLAHGKIMPRTSRGVGWLGAEAKFFWSDRARFRPLEVLGAETISVYLGVDDDILYPPDYVAKLIEGLDRHPGAIVGVHGKRFRLPITSYYRSLDVFAPFAGALSRDQRVHCIGTGTCAFRPAEVSLDMSRFPWPNMTDLWLAVMALEAGHEMWAIARGARWLQPIATPGYSISLAMSGGRGRDLPQTEVARLQEWPEL